MALQIPEPEGEAERRPRRQVEWGRTEEASGERGEEEVAGKRGWPSCSFDGMEATTANGTGKKEGAADGGGGGGSGKKPAPPPPSAVLGELFRFADGLDYVLMAIGTVGAIVHGCSLPIFLRFFADLVHSFGSNADDPDAMVR